MFSNILQAKTKKREYSFRPRNDEAKLGLESETATMLLSWQKDRTLGRFHEILMKMLRNDEIEAGLARWSKRKRKNSQPMAIASV